MNISLKQHVTPQITSVPADCEVEHALMIMKNHHFRHLPIVDEKNEVIGLVSDRDLYRGLSSDIVFVADVMSKNIVKVDVKSDIRVVVNTMITQKISALLVTENDKIKGIITNEDLLVLLAKLLDNDNQPPTLLEEFVNSFQEYAKNLKDPNYI